jgi:hypothetical protein
MDIAIINSRDLLAVLPLPLAVLGAILAGVTARRFLRSHPRQRQSVSVDFDGYKKREDNQRQIRKGI